MSSENLTSLAKETHNFSEITLEKQIHSSQTQYYKNMAFLAYRTGNEDMGKHYLTHAIEYAEKEDQALSISDIQSIMDGKVSINSEKTEINSLQSKDTKEIQSAEFLKQLQENVAKIRNQLENFQSTLSSSKAA